MFSFRSKVQDSVDSLRERGGAVAQSAGKAVSQSAAHIATLGELLCVEVEECADRVVLKAKVLFVGLCLFLCGYGFLMVLVCYLLAQNLGWVWALGIVGGFHLVVGTMVTAVAMNLKLGPFAPETRRELKNDVECIKILLKEENRNS